LLQFLIHMQHQRHERWQQRLISILEYPPGRGRTCGAGSSCGCWFFWAKPGKRKYFRELKSEEVLRELNAAFG
jgi:hypothetical protein